MKPDAFGKEHARGYDQGNAYLGPITTNLHSLIEVLLSELKPGSRILCVGAGTGAEIVALARVFPGFHFVGVDPSEAMLGVCRERVQSLGLEDRCELVVGSVHDVPEGEVFDGALCLLVLHHTSEEERVGIVDGIGKRLRKGGVFISSELSIDLWSSTADIELGNWKSLVRRSGIAEEKLAGLPAMMKQHLGIMAPAAYELLLARAGFRDAVQFFQSFLIRAWCVRK